MSATPILRPSGGLTFRIPSLITTGGELTLLCDARPGADPTMDWQSIGGAMAEDLPNPNYLVLLRFDGETWSKPVRLPGTPRVCGDAASAGEELAYAASDQIGYFGSTLNGPRLEAWLAWGSDPMNLTHRRADELYEELRADAIFATSGSAQMLDDVAAFPYVVRRGESTEIRLVHVRAGQIEAMSQAITAPAPLDETAVCLTQTGTVLLSSRIQGHGGRFEAESSDGITFTEPRHIDLPDPGCNACFAVSSDTYFIHPHAHSRDNGAILRRRRDYETVHRLSPGEFGYSDAAWLGHDLIVVFEREGGLWMERVDARKLVV
ncbi:MAG: sialidase family protein [Flaviflexus sp.]|nr:sialidase family protein [Flaviflexus sp.]